MQPKTDISSRPQSRGAKAYFIASAVAQVFALLRYTLLTRLLGPEQLGLAATLLLTSQFFQSITDSGSDRFLIQDRDGDAPEVQRLAHLVYVGRGAFQAAALLLFAAPIAAFLKTPLLQWGLMGLALSPLISGFIHLDFRRVQRTGDFRAEGYATLAAETASLVATLAAAFVTRDFTAVLYGLTVRSLVLVVVSHLVAHRRYEIGDSKIHQARMLRFSAPLMLNGLLIFLGSQGDRVVVAKQLGMAELGQYTAVLLLIFYPTSMLMRYMSAVHLPHIAAARDDRVERDRAGDILAGQTVLLGLLMCAGFAVVAPTAISVLYGPGFAKATPIIALIGILQATRFIRQWPTTEAVGVGLTGVVLANNIMRMVGLAAAVVGVIVLGGLLGVLLGFILGEVAAMITALFMLNRAISRPLWREFDRCAMFALSCLCILGWSLEVGHPQWTQVTLLLAASGVMIAWHLWRESGTLRDAAQTARRTLKWA